MGRKKKRRQKEEEAEDFGAREFHCNYCEHKLSRVEGHFFDSGTHPRICRIPYK